MRPLIEPADGRPDMLAGARRWELVLAGVVLRVAACGVRRGWIG